MVEGSPARDKAGPTAASSIQPVGQAGPEAEMMCAVPAAPVRFCYFAVNSLDRLQRPEALGRHLGVVVDGEIRTGRRVRPPRRAPGSAWGDTGQPRHGHRVPGRSGGSAQSRESATERWPLSDDPGAASVIGSHDRSRARLLTCERHHVDTQGSEGAAVRAASVQNAAAHPRSSFQLHVVRRHVDLLRVSSALCPKDRSAC